MPGLFIKRLHCILLFIILFGALSLLYLMISTTIIYYSLGIILYYLIPVEMPFFFYSLNRLTSCKSFYTKTAQLQWFFQHFFNFLRQMNLNQMLSMLPLIM